MRGAKRPAKGVAFDRVVRARHRNKHLVLKHPVPLMTSPAAIVERPPSNANAARRSGCKGAANEEELHAAWGSAYASTWVHCWRAHLIELSFAPRRSQRWLVTGLCALTSALCRAVGGAQRRGASVGHQRAVRQHVKPQTIRT